MHYNSYMRHYLGPLVELAVIVYTGFECASMCLLHRLSFSGAPQSYLCYYFVHIHTPLHEEKN